MKLPRVRLALALLFGLVYATPSLAQYMYLDSNGDGIHTAADQVNPTGPTVIDLWLDTDSNRDGSAVVCAQGNHPLSIISYAFYVTASGGTVSWGTFVNAVPGFGVHFGAGKTDTDLFDGYGGLPQLPPGLYRLGQVQMSVVSGSPSIQFLALGPGSPDWTSFGSACSGFDLDNTMKLSQDWFDADGLPFGTGGMQNGAPVMAQPTDMHVSVGELASQALSATDADRQPLTFSMISGPRFVRVNTLDPGSGTATGIVHLAPYAGDEGRGAVVVEATDGALSDQRTFAVEVAPGANHPPALTAPQRIEVVAGAVRRVPILGLDADGQALTYSKVAGPDYMNVVRLFSGPAATAGSIRLAPDLCDAGASTAEVSATDGVATTGISLEILVRIPTKAPASQANYLGNGFEEAVALDDFNSDGHLDVVVADRSATVRTFLGKGDGSLTEAASLSLGHSELLGMATGDFNQDGHADAVVTLANDNVARVLLGRGDGSFTEGQTLDPLSFPYGATVADMNRDGDLDVLFANASGSAVALFLGNGDGTFASKRDIEFGFTQREVAVADFNRDGLPDLAASCSQAGSEGDAVGVRLGFGDGTFDDPKTFSLGGGFAYAIVAGDWNWDGRPDVVVSDWGGGRIVTFLGDGAGGFAPGVALGGFSSPQSLDSADFNGDGIPDLLVGDSFVNGPSPTQILYGFGDGRFGNARPLSTVSMYDVASGDLNEDGFPDAVFVGKGLNVWFNDAAGAGAGQARAFSRLDSHRLFPFIAALAPECVRLEPVKGSYVNSDVNYRSIVLSSEGTGSVSQIPAIFESRPPQRDFDRNGVMEIPVCFERRDLNRLFDNLRGRQSVTAHLEGALADGRRFCAPVELDIAGYKRHFIVFLTPNPLNPQATLTYSTTTDGFVRIRVFDLSGRLVRTLVDQPMVPAGDHSVVIDGRNQSGSRLASGIYFYQVEAQEGTVRGRMTVLK